MLDSFILYALLAGIGIALVTGPLGSFIVWRRMAYFGDTLAHAALLGIAFGVVLGIDHTIGIVLVGILLAFILGTLRGQGQLAYDTLLGILAHFTLSAGLIVLALMDTPQVTLTGLLFGDILATTPTDLYWIYIGGGAVLLMLVWLWRPLLAVTVNEELAQVEGTPVAAVRIAFILMLSLVIALAMKVVGVLLTTALLIIPAAAARHFAHTPEQMAIYAAIIGCLSVAGGLGVSLQWDTPVGPSTVCIATALFAIAYALPGHLKTWASSKGT